MKYVYIKQNGFEWKFPLSDIANNRADYYADEGDREGEYNMTMENESEATDWFKNNMNFDEISNMELVKTPPVPEEPSQMEEYGMEIIDE